ncbi:hypothetical protein EON78_05005, partial [bacterium]
PTNIIYVNSSATGANDGTSWANAYTSLQMALTGATSGKDIWVAAGTYKPGTLTSDTFQLKAGVNIYGGFAGIETQKTQRNLTTNITILSGDLNNSNSADTSDSINIVKGANTCIIDGFTIQYSYNTSFGGGGMFNENVSPTVNNITFSNNHSTGNGGAISNLQSSSPIINNVIFSSNSAISNGGAMYNSFNSSPIINNATFSSNSANNNGGAMFNSNSSSPSINSTNFSFNSATNSGGAIINAFSSSPVINNSTFSSNNSSTDGGAIHTRNSSLLTLTNVTFFNNSANNGSAINIRNSSSSIIKNSIFWGSTTSMIYQNSGTLKIGYSNLQNGYSNINLDNSIAVVQNLDGILLDTNNFTSVGHNISADPLFSLNSLTLQAGSPSINTGTSVGAPAKDIIGTSRPQGSGYDMGAYEFIQ